uniref:Uncharacterized protein n=1 Tax=Triticum urartu TaxID=4572 RepID=A0A8R7Q1A0_TRIUA
MTPWVRGRGGEPVLLLCSLFSSQIC